MSQAASTSTSGNINFADPNASKSAWIPWAAIVAVVLLLALVMTGKKS